MHIHAYIHTYICTKPTATTASIGAVEAGESKLVSELWNTPWAIEYVPASHPIQVDAELAPAGAAQSVTCEVRGGTLSRDACARKQPYMSYG